MYVLNEFYAKKIIYVSILNYILNFCVGYIYVFLYVLLMNIVGTLYNRSEL